MFVILHVQRELPGLSVAPGAAWNSALVGPLTSVHEHVLLEVLWKGESLIADSALVLGHSDMGLHVAHEAKLGLIDSLAVPHIA
jgi:hypothetical protein